MSKLKLTLTASFAVSMLVLIVLGFTALLASDVLKAESSGWRDYTERAAQTEELRVRLKERHAEIFADPASPIAGNPEGDVTLVQFFDYNCSYCRAAAPIVRQAKDADAGLKLVYKEFPILGSGSRFAAQAALASRKQDKYEEFHSALMGHSGAINESSTLDIAERVGLDVHQLQRDIQDPVVMAAVERNLALGLDLRITGTPSFFVGDEIVRGLVDLQAMQGFIAEARRQVGE
ncbi:DsbA family protein [Aurantimonas sp. 22II-16-19i]|uniref:DsbA family protein n=1 Tax=Aurantimonas sp. 22II-16-19i TaxID=1317114 RepID=UPI001FDA008E|nr:DsbA family protein [Aurantimonas sp. 22II-16-19i]